MGMYGGLSKEGFKTSFGSRSDVCYDCMMEKMVEKKTTDSGLVTRELKGKLEGKTVRRLPQFGYVLCEEHILKMADEIKAIQEELKKLP